MNATTQGNGPILLKKFKDLEEDSNVILIFGKTRAGKSTFVNDVKGKKVVKSTSSMKSDTMDTSAVKVKLSGGRTVYLTDTIGFGGSGVDHSHTDLAARYIDLFHTEGNNKGPKIAAFLYIIDIKDRAGLDAGSERNLEFMKAFLGKGLFPNLFFVTNQWSKDEDEREEQKVREKEWKSELNRRFPGAPIERLHYKYPHAGETKLKKMNTQEREFEQGKYKESTLKLVKLALKNPAEKRTLLEQEIGDSKKPMVGQTTLFQAAAVTREKDIKEMEKAGKDAEAKVMRDETNKIRDTTIDNAGDVAKARKIAREAGEKAMGEMGGAIGAWYNRAGEGVVGAYSAFATEKQANALSDAYHNRMVPRTAAMAKAGAEIAGTPGAMVATAAGTAANWVDGTVTFWTSLFKSETQKK